MVSLDGSGYVSVGNVTSGVIGNGSLTGVLATVLVQGSSHTWSVRVGKTNASAASGSDLGQPSATLNFTTALTPPGVSTPQFPNNGTMNVPVNAMFTWPAGIAGSTYEFVISEASDVNTAANPFAIITDSFGSLSNTTLLTAPLKYSTQYYWEVRTVTGTSKSAWTVSTFTTEAAPVVVTTPATTAPPVTTIIVPTQPAVTPTVTIINSGTTGSTSPAIPSYLLWAVIVVGAVLVIAVIVLIVRTRRIP